jgi:MSHA pilin protein MshA
MNKNINRSAQGGFTLIELIVVIVILGVLAATALPKFSDMGGEARLASLRAAKGALTTTSAVAHGQFLLDPKANGAKVKMENVDVNMANGYPAAETALATAAGLTGDDYTVNAPSGSTTNLTISPKGVSTEANCQLTYAPATKDANGAVTAPVITVNGTGPGCN